MELRNTALLSFAIAITASALTYFFDFGLPVHIQIFIVSAISFPLGIAIAYYTAEREHTRDRRSQRDYYDQKITELTNENYALTEKNEGLKHDRQRYKNEAIQKKKQRDKREEDLKTVLNIKKELSND